MSHFFLKCPCADKYRRQAALRDESPALKAHQRKTAKTNAQIPDAAGPNSRDTANASKKRKRAPSYERRQTRSQAKSQQIRQEAKAVKKREPTKIAVMKVPMQNTSTENKLSGTPKGEDPAATAQQIVEPVVIGTSVTAQRLEVVPQKRKRREILQDEDLDTFLWSALNEM